MQNNYFEGKNICYDFSRLNKLAHLDAFKNCEIIIR